MNRREFVGNVAAGAAALAISLPTKVLGASDRVRNAIIGVGDRGQQDLKDAIACSNAECVAVADIYSRRRDQANLSYRLKKRITLQEAMETYQAY